MRSTSPAADDDVFTFCAPIPSAITAIRAQALSNEQFSTLLKTHLGGGALYAADITAGLTVPTDAPSQSLLFRLEDDAGNPRPGVCLVNVLGMRVCAVLYGWKRAWLGVRQAHCAGCVSVRCMSSMLITPPSDR